ncbi:MAG: hypothetical protein CMC15_17610 [Flavobacteriaceae bacterium]|nr:hypothetical protein [Flavobacteriaceae bacterium]
MGINQGSINKGGSTITELTVVNGASIDSTTLVIDDTNNLVKVGDDLSLISDSSVIKMGAGNDVTLTHDGTTGVTIAATPITVDSGGALNLHGTSINVGTDTDVAIDIDASTLDIDASGLVTIDSSGGPISIGATDQDQDINIGIQGTRTITVGVDNDGADATTVKINSGDVKIQNTSTTNGTFPTLTLQTGDNAIIANNILGQIDFQAPDDTGVDSDIVAASIVAIAEETFSDTSNATSLQLRTGASEVATTKVTIDSAGKVGIGDTDPGTALQVSGADAYITLKNTTAENSDGGAETKIIFEDHANAALGQIETSHSGSADDTKGKMIFSTHTGSSLTAALTIDDTQKASFAGNVDITGGLSFDAGTAVTSIDTDLSSVSGSDDSLASAKAIKAYVDSTSGGASALNGLSDVSYSSGDLIISSLDTLTTSATANDAAGQDVLIRGGQGTAGGTNNLAGGTLTLQGGAGKGSGASGKIKFDVVPATGSGNSVNTTTQTQMTIDQSGIVVNEDGNVSDFRIESEDWQHMFILDADANRIGIGYDNDGVPNATLNVRNNNDNSGGGVPLVLLDNDNVDVIALDIDAANTATAVVTINADSLTTTNTAGQTAAFFMSCDALTTGTAFEINSASLNTSSRSLMKVQNTHGNADNVTMLHLNNGAHDNDAPFVLLEYSGNQTNHPMILEFRRSDNGSETSGMDLGQINFVGHDGDNNLTTYVQISTEAEDVTGGGEDGELEFKTQVAGTLTSQLKIDSSGVHLPTGLAAAAAASNQDTNNGNVTSNNFKITHTLTLDGALSDGSGITEFTVTSDKVLATSVVIASSNLLDMSAPREVVAGSFKVSGKNKTGGTLADDSTVIINYLIL